MIVYEEIDDAGWSDLWVRHLGTNSEDAVEPLSLNTPFNESRGRVSPDGRWIAYVTDESGQDEVWIASFPSGEDRTQVSVGGGRYPEWRGDNRELFYLSSERALMAVAIQRTASAAQVGTPELLFRLDSAVEVFDDSFDMYAPTADGQRFLVAFHAESSPQPPIRVIVNWPTLIEGR